MSEIKKIKMHKGNGTDYDTLYPYTSIDQVENLQNNLDTKVDINQGTTHAGKVLGINSSGNVEPTTITVPSYTAGNGLNLSNNEFSIDEQITATKTYVDAQIATIPIVTTSDTAPSTPKTGDI